MAEEVPATEKKSNVPYEYTQGSYWGGPSISYFVYAALAVIPFTGLLGLDHLYLRSPGTALKKIGINLVTFGLWYFYDVLHALFDGENTRKYGLETPFGGPAGIGAGMFLEGDEEAPAGTPGAFTFMAYAACVFFVPFGVEYLVAGDTWGFIGKLVSYITFIVPAYVWIRQMYALCSDPTELFKCGPKRYVPFMKSNSPTNPFGAGGPVCSDPEDDSPGFIGRIWAWIKEHLNIFEKIKNFILNMPLIGRLFSLGLTVLEILGVIRKTATDTVEGVAKVGEAAGKASGAFSGLTGMISSAVSGSSGLKKASEAGFMGSAAEGKKGPAGNAELPLENLKEKYSTEGLTPCPAAAAAAAAADGEKQEE